MRKMEYKISTRVSERIYRGLVEVCDKLDCTMSYLLRGKYEEVIEAGKSHE